MPKPIYFLLFKMQLVPIDFNNFDFIFMKYQLIPTKPKLATELANTEYSH